MKKNKLFLCIRPTVAETVEESDERRRYVVVSKERSGVGHRRRQRTVDGGGGGGGGSHKTFSQAIKAVLFEVSLRKSVRERQLSQLMPRSISQTKTHSAGSNNEPVQSQPELQQPISRVPSFSSSNSSNTKLINDNSSLNYDTYLVVISLFVTIFWGKIFAIFCTTMWMLYIGPRPSKCEDDRRSESGIVKLPETEEEMAEYKKRVIMGGMLERNHRCRDRERALNLLPLE